MNNRQLILNAESGVRKLFVKGQKSKVKGLMTNDLRPFQFTVYLFP